MDSQPDNLRPSSEYGPLYNLLTIRFEDGNEESFFIELTETGTFVVPDPKKEI